MTNEIGLTSADCDKPRRLGNILVGALFLCALVAPALQMLYRDSAARSGQAEFRSLAALPGFPRTAKEFGEFPGRFTEYFQDSFGLRENLLALNNEFKWSVLNQSPTDQLLKGVDGWVFYTQSQTIETYRGTNRFGPGELDSWQRGLEERRDWLAERGIQYLYVIVPNKSSIYADMLPAGVEPIGPSRREQFFRHMQAKSDVHVLDLFDALQKEREFDDGGDLTYNKYGTHWTDRGGLAGYRAILGELRRYWPDLRIQPREDFIRRPSTDIFTDSWAGRMYLTDVLDEEFYSYTQKRPRKSVFDRTKTLPPRAAAYHIRGSKLPRGLLLHDSFGRTVQPYLSESFSELTSYWLGAFDREIIEHHKPEVVVQLYVERVLVTRDAVKTGTERIGMGSLFQGLGTRLFAQNGTQLGTGLRVVGRTALALQSGGGKGLEITTQSLEDRVVLPGFAMKVPAPWVAKFDVTSPQATTLSVIANVLDDQGETVEQVRSVAVKAGRGSVMVELPKGKIVGGLGLQFADIQDGFVLRHVEVRGRD